MENEIWKDVIGYKGLYKVSNLGNVKKILIKGKGNYYRGEFCANNDNTRGYIQISLTKDFKRKKVYLHRIVAMAFIYNQYNKPDVNHIDGNKKNNSVSNLEWVTEKENAIHAFKTGLNRGRKGKENTTSKKIIDTVSMEIFYSIGEAAKSINKKRSTVKAMLIGQNKNYTNLIFYNDYKRI